jgi:hypothetical protein
MIYIIVGEFGKNIGKMLITTNDYDHMTSDHNESLL